MNQQKNQQSLKLTAYFTERQPALPAAGAPPGRFLAEAMLNLFGTREVATSVMLRGIGGFGPRHVLRTDESLSLSEDPPVTVAAVDVESKISGLIDDVVAMTEQGFVTLERARLVRGGDETPAAAGEGGAGLRDVTKLTVYVGRQDRIDGVPAQRAVCDLLYQHGFAGTTVLLGVDGTAHGHRRRARFFSRNVNVPQMIIGIGTAQQVSAAVADLGAGLPNALLTVERVRLCKRDGQLWARPQQLPAVNGHDRPLWQKLMVHTAEDTAAAHDGLPIHRGLVRRLRQSQTVRGATVLRGVWGFHGNHKPHGDRLFQLGRRVPVVTIIVGAPEAIARSFDIVDELTERHGLVTSEMVPAAVSIEGGRRRGDTRLAHYDY